LERLSEMNISVKSHMSVVDEETASRTKEVILGQKSEILVEKRVKETVIRRRKKLVKKPSESPIISPEAEEKPAGVSAAVSEKTSPKKKWSNWWNQRQQKPRLKRKSLKRSPLNPRI
jgi:hypothetical protein